MANIPISQVVQVNPRVIGAGSAQSSLDGLLLTQSEAVAPNQGQLFFSAADVASFFGPGSDEAAAARVYFAGILNGGQLPGSLLFARYAADDTSGEVYGARLNMTLSELQTLSGTLTVTTDTARKSANIDLSGATSFANAAELMTAGFTTPNFAVTYDSDRRRFLLTTVATGEDATVSAVTGTLADDIGLSAASGAYAQTAGVLADDPQSAMARALTISGNWGLFTHVWAADLAERLGFAQWASTEGLYEYGYVGWDTDAGSVVFGNADSFGAQVFAQPYQGTIPVYGDLTIAAGVLAWAAATNYQIIEGRNALAFRQVAAGPTPSVNSLAEANAALSNGYTYLGSYASASSQYSVLYNGALSGQFNWADTYLGQIWLRRTLQQALFDTLLNYNTLPYNADGYNAIYQGAQTTITQAQANGVIREGVTLSASQRAQVNQQAGFEIDKELSARGWFLQVQDPLNTAVRTQRGSPTVNFWYCDGGSIQRIVVSSTTVL